MLTVLRESLIKCANWCARIKLSLCFIYLLLPSVSAQFIPVGNELGVVQINTGTAIFGTGVSVHDFDGDGLDDLSFGTIDEPPRFYRNTGLGFEPYEFMLPSPPLPIKSILWVDIDNDGDKDLLLTYENGPIRLYENTSDLVLVDITESSGITLENGIRYTGASFGDYNNDGYLDFYVCKFYNSNMFSGVQYENKLYRNNGDNTFTDVTYEANASVGVNASFMASWFDYNGDGWQDLFIVNDRIFNQNYLLKNNGDGTFSDVSEATGINYSIDAMGFAPADYNNDLLIDFFVANSQFMGNHLYQHQPDHTFANVAPEAGVEAYELCWSGLWMDHNNNGWQDLHVGVEFTVFGQFAPNLFYINNGDGTFTESAESLWLYGDYYSTYSSAHGDWNNDGYPDFVTSNKAPHPCMLWQNTGGSNNYLAVTLEGSVSNRDAIGTHLCCYTADSAQMRYMLCGENYLGQNSQRKLFGIGTNTHVDSLVVHWLSGHIDTFYNLPANETYHFREGQSVQASIVTPALSLCQNDTLELFAPFGEQIQWSNGASNVSIISITQPGEYWYTAETPIGITFTSDTLVINANGLPEIEIITHPPSCQGLDDGSIELQNPFLDTNLWVELNGLPAGWFNENLPSGTHLIEIGNEQNCSATFETYIPEALALEAVAIPGEILCFGGFTTVDWLFFGGHGVVTIDWGVLHPDSLFAGNYNLLVTDSHQCTTFLTFTLQEPSELEVVISQEDATITAFVTGGTPPYNFAWHVDGVLTSNSHQVTNEGAFTYQLQVTDDHGCWFTSEVEAIVAIASDAKPVVRTLYPNPAQDLIYYSGPCDSNRLSIISSDGSTVLEISCIDSGYPLSIPIAELPSGLYAVVFDQKHGGVLRFVKN